MIKPDDVKFIDESLENSFNQLKEDDPLKKGIRRAITAMREDVFAGRNVKKELIPKSLIQKYKISNLRIYDLPDHWRLIYSVTSGGQVEIIAAILDWMDHKDYERLFKF